MVADCILTIYNREKRIVFLNKEAVRFSRLQFILVVTGD